MNKAKHVVALPIRLVVLAAALWLVLSVPCFGAAGEPRLQLIDLHVDLSYQSRFRGKSLARGTEQYVADWLLGSSVAGVVFPLFIPHDVSPTGPRGQDLDASFQALKAQLPTTAPYSLRGCQAGPGEVAAFYAFEGSAPLGRDLDSIWEWARRGIRLYGLVHSRDNLLATSAGHGYTPRAVRTGLSETGKELVRRIHATGGIVDVSHASDATFDDVLQRARADAMPMVATHSNARALAPHTRNLTDTQLRRIAETGGVVGVNFHSPFLLGGPGRASVDDVVRHIRHIADVAGIDTVAIGSDFEGGIRPPRQLSNVKGFPALAQALSEAGFSRAEIAKIWGENARRVLCPPGAKR